MRYGISWLKRSARERTKEEMNKFAKKAKIQVSAKRKKNIRDFFFFLKETQIRDKPKHGEEAKQEVKEAKTLFLTIYC